jgi:hypothetical protein
MKKTSSAKKINLIFFSLISMLFLIGFLFTAAGAKVVHLKAEGEVASIEPQRNEIVIELDDTILSLTANSDTVFKGVKGLKGIKEEDEVKIEYKIDEHGRKFLTILEK